ncbi:tetratricopeptide repeat protein [Prosthecobacter sp.]|uniref:tetratricopeptide repeat protein n=1 Tax=Prosthecobacter sp. TaxID=1965333 RepID=UPI0037839158
MAIYYLGATCLNGDGVPKDAAKAAQYFRQSAERGYAKAQLWLSLRYENGDGVKKDLVQAWMWIHLAAMQGNKTADAHQATLELSMTPEQIKAAEALADGWKKREESKPGETPQKAEDPERKAEKRIQID